MRNSTKTLTTAAIVALTILLLTTTTPAIATDTIPQQVQSELQHSDEPIEILVELNHTDGEQLIQTHEQKEGIPKTQIQASQEELTEYANNTDKIEVLNTFWIINAALIEIQPDTEYTEILDIENVETLTPNEKLNLPDKPSNTQLNTQTNNLPDQYEQILEHPQLYKTYQEFNKGDDIKIAAIDTGIDIQHPDLDLYTEDPNDPTYPGGYAKINDNSEIEENVEPYDEHGHGTIVSGILTGSNTGIAPEADLMMADVSNDDEIRTSNLLTAVEWAVENDADLITASMGSDPRSLHLEIVENAHEEGLLYVAPTGNLGDKMSPGIAYNTLGIGISGLIGRGEVIAMSTRGVIDTSETWGSIAPDDWPDEYTTPDILAPGLGVATTNPEYTDGGDKYETYTGSSYSTAVASGIISIALSESDKQHDPMELHKAVLRTANYSEAYKPNPDYGHGVIDAYDLTSHLLDTASLTGTIYTPDGEPAENAVTHIENVRAGYQTSEYDAELSEGVWNVQAIDPDVGATRETVTLNQDESKTQDLTLEGPGIFEVENITTPTTKILPGSTVEVGMEINNIGEKDTQDIDVKIVPYNEDIDEASTLKTLTEEISHSTEETVEVDISSFDDGRYMLGVYTDYDIEMEEIEIGTFDPSYYAVDGLTSIDEANPGEELDISATVENTGDNVTRQNVSVKMGKEELTEEDVVDEKFVRLEFVPRDVSFNVTAPEEEGEYMYGVFTENESVTSTFEVNMTEDHPFFDEREVIPHEDVVGFVIEWNLEESIQGVEYEREEVIDFLVEWNLEDSGGESVQDAEAMVDSPTEDVSDELWVAVTWDGVLELQDLGGAIQAYQDEPEDADVSGVEIELADLGSMIGYYQSMQ